MKLEREAFVEWLEAGNFQMGEFRSRLGNRLWAVCEECVMAKYAAHVTGDSTMGAGYRNAYGKGGCKVEFEPWAEAVVRVFDENYPMWSQDQMVRELAEVALKC